MPEKSKRAEMIETLLRSLQRQSVESVLFNQMVADRMGVNLTDLKCVSILQLEGAITAGRLAELAGLTGGAITGVIDRLEKARLVERAADPDDRRRVILKQRNDRVAEFIPLFGALSEMLNSVCAQYSESELATILDFTSRAATAQQALRVKLTEEAKDSSDGERFVAPLGRLTSARLEFPRGAWSLRVTGDRQLSTLYDGRFEEQIPSVHQEGGRGIVTVQYKWPSLAEAARMMLGTRKAAGRLVLNGTIPWEIDLRGGAARIEMDLSTLPVRSLRVLGGVSDVEITLPEPDGTVEIRVHGGASNLRFHRPASIPARMQIVGGVSRLRFDDQPQRPAEGYEGLESPGYGTARNRYDVQVAGGASKLTFDFTDASRRP